jgi:methyl-accepting chemotaxis protein
VVRASATVKSQSDNVIEVAQHEQEEVEGTGKTLVTAVEAMNNIAQLALECDAAAEGAIDATRSALESVTHTVDGISGIRDTIHETEKRIKRLGDRSQEITRAVNLINTISERTHILALNASMHAASAGEAGRGFAIVADEVQRLAENARDATSQIATLVSNIQVETSDTVSTMNDLITEVVDGSRLATTAGSQMKRTMDSTENLVHAVRQIAERSQKQAQVSNDLQGRYERIRESSQQTTVRLTEQTKQTRQLVQYAKRLLQAVQVFKLPGARSAVMPVAGETARKPITPVQHKKAS